MHAAEGILYLNTTTANEFPGHSSREVGGW